MFKTYQVIPQIEARDMCTFKKYIQFDDWKSFDLEWIADSDIKNNTKFENWKCYEPRFLMNFNSKSTDHRNTKLNMVRDIYTEIL